MTHLSNLTHSTHLIEAIDQAASTLPPEFQREVLDFIGYLRIRPGRLRGVRQGRRLTKREITASKIR